MARNRTRLARGDFNARKRVGPDRLMTGEPCPVIVTRLVLDKATREIVAIRYATLMQLCEGGRTELEPMGDYYRFSNEVFYGTEPIEGCDD